MTEQNLRIERLTTYSAEDARGIGRLMPFLSSRLDDSPISKELLEAIVYSRHHEQLVARLDSIIVGSATLNILMGPAVQKAGYLEDFVTDPEIRRMGVGDKIWSEMMKWCNEQGTDLNFTSKNERTDAHRFYLSHGAVVRDTTVFNVPRSSV